MEKIFLTGNVGKDAEYTEKDGRGMAKFSVAVTKYVKGEKKTCWRSVAAFGKTAEFCKQYVTKGRTVAVIGNPMERSYKTKLDEYVATIDVTADAVELVGNRADGDQSGNNQTAQPAPAGFVPVEGDGDLPF